MGTYKTGSWIFFIEWSLLYESKMLLFDKIWFLGSWLLFWEKWIRLLLLIKDAYKPKSNFPFFSQSLANYENKSSAYIYSYSKMTDYLKIIFYTLTLKSSASIYAFSKGTWRSHFSCSKTNKRRYSSDYFAT